MFDLDYAKSPLLVIWEVTRGCALACQHCRAATWDFTDPEELSTDEGKRLIDGIKAMGTPIVVFTGGDPLRRDDLEELIAHARSLGLKTGAIPATSPRLTRERVMKLKAAGLEQMALSIDAPNAEEHDGFRRVPGCFDKAIEAATWARDAGIALQVNTVFAAWNAHHGDAMVNLVAGLGPVFWEVFFLVPVGRGADMTSCTPMQMETLFTILHQASQRVPFIVKVTEAPQYRVYLAKQRHALPLHPARDTAPLPSAHHHVGGALKGERRGINSGKGFCFVDHHGEVMPSGFLPAACGNVRERDLATIYREHPTFLALRDPEKLEGGCGLCTWNDLCGGSRARAFGVTGNMFAAEPICELARRLESAPTPRHESDHTASE